mmetsp:Transcript_20773/g.34658  ORF Transcript_20773/g.34658 Transcript_20773/m.34658 type:complete len:84 (-) Transcript_20773:531-782(-)
MHTYIGYVPQLDEFSSREGDNGNDNRKISGSVCDKEYLAVVYNKKTTQKNNNNNTCTQKNSIFLFSKDPHLLLGSLIRKWPKG